MNITFVCQIKNPKMSSKLHLLEHVILNRLNKKEKRYHYLKEMARTGTMHYFETFRDLLILEFRNIKKDDLNKVRKYLKKIYINEEDLVKEKEVLKIESCHYNYVLENQENIAIKKYSKFNVMDIETIKKTTHKEILKLSKEIKFREINLDDFCYAEEKLYLDVKIKINKITTTKECIVIDFKFQDALPDLLFYLTYETSSYFFFRDDSIILFIRDLEELLNNKLVLNKKYLEPLEFVAIKRFFKIKDYKKEKLKSLFQELRNKIIYNLNKHEI